MNNKEYLYELLKTEFTNVAQNDFKTPPPLPYIVYYSEGIKYMYFDNKNGAGFEKFTIELYTKKNETEDQQKLRNLLNNNNLPFTESDDIYIEKENCFVKYFKIIKGVNDGRE